QIIEERRQRRLGWPSCLCCPRLDPGVTECGRRDTHLAPDLVANALTATEVGGHLDELLLELADIAPSLHFGQLCRQVDSFLQQFEHPYWVLVFETGRGQSSFD